jgi:hypothetical protein
MPLTLRQGVKPERLLTCARYSQARTGCTIWRGALVPWYSFTVLGPDGAAKDAGSTNLPDSDAARHYGQLIIRELKQREGNHDPKTNLVIKNDTGEVSHIIPF